MGAARAARAACTATPVGSRRPDTGSSRGVRVRVGVGVGVGTRGRARARARARVRVSPSLRVVGILRVAHKRRAAPIAGRGGAFEPGQG